MIRAGGGRYHPGMPQADPLAQLAVAPVTRGMVVGLGTGRAASRAIAALGERAAREALDLTCIATSDRSAEQAETLGLRVVPMMRGATIDYLFDGADEVDPAMSMLKGRGGAMTREKAAARASRRRVYLVDAGKLVSRLGERFMLPVEVRAGSLREARAVLASVGLVGAELRMADGGGEYFTDNGNPVLDVPVPAGADPAALDRALNAAPCIVGHGLFLTEADEVLVERAALSEAVERRVRGAGRPT